MLHEPGFLIGAAVGIPVGFGAYQLAANDPLYGCGDRYSGHTKCTSTERVLYPVLEGLGLGGIGAFIGHRIHSEHWSAVALERIKISLRPEQNGGRVAVGISF
jgi:hypothetical protein